MIDYRTDPTDGVVEFTIDGPITKPEYDRVVAEIDGAIARFGKLRLIEIVKDIGAIDSSIWWPDLKWAAKHLNHIARCAVVTDKGWIGAITRAAAAVLAAEIRVFALADVAEARAWVRERP
ncbi:STAS/SEC14 domain-containing protein [Hephaestia sp. GCM10023244]|uniref:STAS/SEC14 domain-containing protein n=1 Tax=unclassified Hephaestia TaxID=2631281 RepID=UPI0020774870|nr:STAS/SEC14 domain-containing protein [Hephaestia sp. MAHUQ-44]MCM8731783.1 STAS/SEC14 domain-containing protein [Hephaestia sp. MAHUQ-44]